jgi:hypothetical protein
VARFGLRHILRRGIVTLPLEGRAIAYVLATRVPEIFGKNTIDLQWKMRAITMQGLAQASENPPAREQWRAMEKTMRRAMETVGKFGRVLTPCLISLSA